MKRISVVGKLKGKFRFDNMARVYDTKQSSPTVNCFTGGGREIKVIKRWKEK